MYSKYKIYLISAVITFSFAALGAIVTYLGIPNYENIIKPELTPPPIIFPIVWSILFLLMSISAAIIFKSNDINRSNALFIYTLQLIVNFWWCVFFFGFKLYFFSFIWLIILWLLVLMMIKVFYDINHTAGLIQIFYLIWLTFAAYLNFMVWFINR